MNRPWISRALLTLLLTTPAFAWGEKGHLLASEAATWEVPTELPRFFHRAYPDLVWLGYDPDRWRGAGPSADEDNAADHFLDYEYVAGLELPRGRYEFLDLMHSSGTIRRLGIRSETAGFAIWRIAELSELLTEQWRLWRRASTDEERQRTEETIVFFAGVLGHYVADAANPHHSTIHYNGWVGDPERGFRNDCETHSRFESVFVTNAVELGDVVPRLRAPELRDDFFGAALELIRGSNAEVEAIYTLDAAGAFDYPSGTAEGNAYAADRIALGASVLRDLWWSAWRRSGEAPRRRQ